MEQPFYVGQEVVAINDSEDKQVRKGSVFFVRSIKKTCCNWVIDVGLTNLANMICSSCYRIYHSNGKRWMISSLFAPIERAKTKYVVKEVEVAPQIRELEVCQS